MREPKHQFDILPFHDATQYR